MEKTGHTLTSRGDLLGSELSPGKYPLTYPLNAFAQFALLILGFGWARNLHFFNFLGFGWSRVQGLLFNFIGLPKMNSNIPSPTPMYEGTSQFIQNSRWLIGLNRSLKQAEFDEKTFECNLSCRLLSGCCR